MNYYAIFTNHSGLNGVPVFLDCRLWEEIPKDPMAPVDKEFPWTILIPRFAKITLPKKLNLIVKARKISFDFYSAFNGYIVSKEFLDLIVLFNQDFVSTPLEVLSNKFKIITDKEYYFIKFYEYEDVIDYENSIYTKNLSDKGEPMIIQNALSIKKWEFLSLSVDKIKKDVFPLNSATFLSQLYCNQRFKELCEKNKIYGVNFIPIDEVAHYINSSGYLR